MITQIGPYSVEGEIGRGGMGIVYRATDDRLGRVVAIKALPEHFADDPERLARFEREARTLATLNHPNVASIYGVEEHEGRKYLVLEYVEGETLADRLDRGPLPIDDALDLCSQVAAGLEAAHEAGVIHRDLKPANIRITSDGKAKVLDFGLARAEETSSSGSSVSQMPTLTTPMSPHSPTTPGAVLGTAPYMSPEQARGRKVDKRSDIWSFGVVLYECLTGMSPFIGETATDSIGAILHKDVDLGRLPPATPRDVRRVIERCLERDRNERLRDIGDARLEILEARRAPKGSIEGAAPARRAPVAIIAVVALFIGGFVGAAAMLSRSAPMQSPAPVVRSTILPGDGVIVSYLGDVAGPAMVSRDGTKIVFVGRRAAEVQRIYVRSLDSDVAEPLRGTEGATFPFWSWDGQSIGYFAGGDLRRHDLRTQVNRTLCPAPGGRGGTWLADGTIIFSPFFQSDLQSVSAGGGASKTVTKRDESRHTSHRWPRAASDGLGFTYIAVNHNPGMVDESAVYYSRPGFSEDRELTRTQFAGEIVGGNLLIVRDETLYAAPLDLTSGRITGEERPVVDGVVADLTTWLADFSAAANGALVYHAVSGNRFESQPVPGGTTFGESMRTTILDRGGRPVHIAADGVAQNTLAISPDWNRLAISGAPESNSDRTGFDIWIYPLPSLAADGFTGDAINEQQEIESPPRRLTFMNGAEVRPVWSPDGQWIYFGFLFANDSAPWGVYRVRAGGGQPELLFTPPNAGEQGAFPTAGSPDGRYVVMTLGTWVANGVNDVFALDLETKESIPLITSEGDQDNARLSPNGRWMAYATNESGAWEVYVVPFAPAWEQAWSSDAPAPARDARWRISIAGGVFPAWNPDGDELFYISSSDSVIRVGVNTDGPEFQFDVGTPLFDARAEAGMDFDVSEAGAYFAINSFAEERATNISLIMNWQSLLR